MFPFLFHGRFFFYLLDSLVRLFFRQTLKTVKFFGKEIGHIRIIYGKFFCLMSKELTVQSCALNCQLFNLLLQILNLFSLLPLLVENEAIEVFSLSIVLSKISFSFIACICFIYINMLNISQLYNNIYTFVHAKSILIHGIPYTLLSGIKASAVIFLDLLNHHH